MFPVPDSRNQKHVRELQGFRHRQRLLHSRARFMLAFRAGVLAVSGTGAEKNLFRVQTKRETMINIKRKTVLDEFGMYAKRSGRGL